MSVEREAIARDLRERVARIAYVEPDSVTDETRYIEDLNVESSGAVQLLVELEELYQVRISDEEALALETVGQTADLIVSKQAGR